MTKSMINSAFDEAKLTSFNSNASQELRAKFESRAFDQFLIDDTIDETPQQDLSNHNSIQHLQHKLETAFRKPLEELPNNRKNGRNYNKPENTQSIPVYSIEENKQPSDNNRVTYTMLHKAKTNKFSKIASKDKNNTPYQLKV